MPQSQYDLLMSQADQAEKDHSVLFCLVYSPVSAGYDADEWVKSNLGAQFISRSTFDQNNSYWEGAAARAWAREVQPNSVRFYLTTGNILRLEG
jgi:hypothetical protein